MPIRIKETDIPKLSYRDFVHIEQACVVKAGTDDQPYVVQFFRLLSTLPGAAPLSREKSILVEVEDDPSDSAVQARVRNALMEASAR